MKGRDIPSPTTFWSHFVEAGARVRGTWRDPALRARWLRDTRKIQAVFVVVVFFGIFGLPPAAEAVGDGVFPPRKVGSFFRKRTERQSASEVLALSLAALFWSAAVVGSARKAYQKLPFEDLTGARDSPDSASVQEAFYETVALGGAQPSPSLNGPSGIATDSRGAAKPEAISTPAISKNRYVIERELGRGGMGIVYEALDSVLGRKVALKSLSLTPGGVDAMISRFRREAQVLASLTHPNIVQIYDLIDTHDGLYIAMELVRGKNLADHLEHQGPLGPEKALELCVPLAQAMAYAHDQGVLHRDFKPHNILLTGDLVPKVTDFGLAKADETPQLTKTGALMGSPTYMSPEQCSGKDLGTESDVYSFGVTLFELLSGRPPFTGGFLKIALEKTTQPPPPLKELAPQVPNELDRLVAKMLESDPKQRISSMKELAEQMRAMAS